VKRNRLTEGLSIALAAALAAACGTSAPSRFYTLDPSAVSDGAPPTRARIAVGPVAIPGAVDRPQLVVQVAPNRVEIDDFNRWAAPLDDGIARAVAVDLTVLLGTPDVATVPLVNFTPDYRVTIDVQRFDSIAGEAALLEAVWVVQRAAGGETRTGRTVAREAVQGADLSTVAAAHSRAIAKLSGDVAAAIRAGAPPGR
jgi:uncharacterized lipoprotein YmbA